jgi:transcriptional regulator with PAS, ATPase and Fis domain
MNALESKIDNYQQKIGTMLCADYSFSDIIGRSEAINRTKELAMRTADKGTTVMLLGESGTGKEMFAHAIHNHSSRRNGHFVKVNCASIPLELIEAELFGYEPGAFTGARNRAKLGKFQMADGGTIFLDEIGDMHHAVQAKVLRVLQEKEVERLGGNRPYKVNVRLIAATNKNLEQAITDGNFRSDLYYRLNVIPIRIPPLRERVGDVEYLIDYFLKILAEKNHEPPVQFTAGAMQCMKDYDWPGNVRELFNAITFAHNSADGQEIAREHLPPLLFSEKQKADTLAEKTDGREKTAFRSTVQESQRKAVLAALQQAGGNKTEAARILNLHRSALYKIMDRLHIA